MSANRIYSVGELVAIKGAPHVVWRIIDLTKTTSGKLSGPGVALRPVVWSTTVAPAGEIHIPTHRLRPVAEMEVIAISCR